MSVLPVGVEWANMILKSPSYGCISEILTAVAMVSVEGIFYRPGGGASQQKAAAAHRRFQSYEGDIPTLKSVYEAWIKEAVHFEGENSRRLYKTMKRSQLNGKIPHPDWCSRNYINARSIAKAHDIRKQLEELCKRSLNMDVSMSCGDDGYEGFLKCICDGLCSQAAIRNVKEVSANKGKKFRMEERGSGRYLTKIGNINVNVHPMSTLFQRNPAPAAVVYTEMLVTKKTYIRGVTQVRPEWIEEFTRKYDA